MLRWFHISYFYFILERRFGKEKKSGHGGSLGMIHIIFLFPA